LGLQVPPVPGADGGVGVVVRILVFDRLSRMPRGGGGEFLEVLEEEEGRTKVFTGGEGEGVIDE
jgi:hypothetical protein